MLWSWYCVVLAASILVTPFGLAVAAIEGVAVEQIQLVHVSNVNVLQEPQWKTVDPRHAEERARLLQRLNQTTGVWDDKHPRWKVLEALHAFDRYAEFAGSEIDRFEGLYKHVPKRHKKVLESTLQYDENFNEARRLIAVNANIAQRIVQNTLDFYGISRKELDDFISESRLDKDSRGLRTSVSQAFKHLVRDWSVDGITERNATFPYILRSLKTYLLTPTNSTVNSSYKVLVPGAGVGRLAHEIASLGPHFQVTSNEYSAFMNIAYRWASSLYPSAPRHVIHPFIETWSHARTRHELFREIHVPDLSAISVHGAGDPPLLVEGDFTTVFASKKHTGQYDAVVTLFFIDTARNLVSYLETIHELLKPGGIWINVGPLLYGSAPWVQLTLDEVITVSEAIGFDFEDDKRQEKEVLYNFNQSALHKNGYIAQYWVAKKEARDGGSGWW